MSDNFSETNQEQQQVDFIKSENTDENELNDETEEIEFDDNIDIDALQNQLMEHMKGDDINYFPEPASEHVEFSSYNTENSLIPADGQDSNTLELDNFMKSVEGEETAPAVIENNNSDTASEVEETPEVPQDNKKTSKEEEKLRLQLGEKKYIVYIEPENVKFMDNLTIKERKKIINKILRDEYSAINKKKIYAERFKFINQIIIMVLTVAVSLPIFFILLNKSIEVTILNYQQSQQRFVKLYKEQGKIKLYKNFQNKF